MSAYSLLPQTLLLRVLGACREKWALYPADTIWKKYAFSVMTNRSEKAEFRLILENNDIEEACPAVPQAADSVISLSILPVLA